VYDVTANRGRLMERERLSVGRPLAGVDKGGVGYLIYRDGASGSVLERTSIIDDTPATD
jgi:hypothetical protein